MEINLSRPGSSHYAPKDYCHTRSRWKRGNRWGELMFATIYLPNFYLQAVLRHQPELQRKPVAIFDDQEKKAVIIQINPEAEQIGVHCGMTPSQGLARSLQLLVKTRK